MGFSWQGGISFCGSADFASWNDSEGWLRDVR